MDMTKVGYGLQVAAAVLFFVASWRGSAGLNVDLVALGLGLLTVGYLLTR